MEIKVNIEAKELVEAINNLAVAIQGVKVSEVKTVETEQKKKTRSKKADPVEDEPVEPEAEETEEDMFDDEEKPAVTRDDVQKRLKEIAGAGKQAEIKKLLTNYKVAKLSALPDDKLAEILEKAEAL